MQTRRILAVATVSILAAPMGATVHAQTDSGGPRITVTPGAHYRAGAFTRAMLGDGWRDVWLTPVRAPVLDPATSHGGLKFDKRGGGRQSITVHFDEANGWREHVFRSVDKFPLQSLADEFQGSMVGRIVQDQTSTFFPAAPLLVPPLLEAIGALYIEPSLYVMGNSPILGVVRDTVAGMLGTFELKPNEAPDDKPGFGESRKIQETEKFFETLNSGHGNRLDEREFLATRLVDFLINDTDRTSDNYEWARFGEKDNYVWRPIPRDRDWAFIDARGVVNGMIVGRFFPKFAKFGTTPKMRSLLYSSHQLDRRLLQRLSAQDFRDVALRVQQAVTDPVIANVIDRLPPEWREGTAAPHRLTAQMRARRDGLMDAAMDFYRNLASEVDLHGTDKADRADIVRHADGRVTVTITATQAPLVAVERREDGTVITTSSGSIETTGDVFYQRTFTAPETKEIRVYLGGDNDVATIRGASNKAILVRVIGGAGDDVLTDAVGAGGAHLYDAEGKNHVIATNETRVVTKRFEGPNPKDGLRLGQPWRPDWGGSSGFAPAIDFHAGAGVIVGGGVRMKSYGFRRLPHAWKAGANLMYGTGNGRAAVTANLDYRAENSPMSVTVEARASQLDATRFFGYGNESADVAKELALVEQRVISVEPSVVWRLNWRARETDISLIRGEDTLDAKGRRPLVGKVTGGPVFSWIDPEPRLDAPLVTTGAPGARGFSLGGFHARLDLDRTDNDAVPTTGWTMRAAAQGHAVLTGGDVDVPFGTVSGSATTYFPLMSRGSGPHVAMRVGGAWSAGDVPVQFAPTIGGKSSVRGYPWRRYTGDAAANAGAELRVPVGTVNFILKSKMGVFALADAGRVWYDGQSGGGWHTGVGGGFWLAALGRSVSVAYAQGETGRIYLKTGLSY